MECRSCIDALTALVDDELSPKEKAAVEEHLAGCSRCREELGSLRGVTEFAGALGQLDPSPWLWIRIKAEVEQPTSWRTALSRVGRFLFRPWVPVSALAGLLVLVFAVNYREDSHPLETEFMTFIQERERLFNEQRAFIFSPDVVYRYRQSRNPFIQPTSHLDRNPFQE